MNHTGIKPGEAYLVRVAKGINARATVLREVGDKEVQRPLRANGGFVNKTYEVQLLEKVGQHKIGELMQVSSKSVLGEVRRRAKPLSDIIADLAPSRSSLQGPAMQPRLPVNVGKSGAGLKFTLNSGATVEIETDSAGGSMILIQVPGRGPNA